MHIYMQILLDHKIVDNNTFYYRTSNSSVLTIVAFSLERYALFAGLSFKTKYLYTEHFFKYTNRLYYSNNFAGI